MAEGIAFDIVSNIVTKLGVAALSEICFACGLKDNLKKLQETLSTINAVLLDADRRQEESNLIRLWIRRLNDVVYDADDLLDAFHTKNLQRENGRTKMQEVREFFSSSNQLAFRYKLGRKIKKIRERLDEIAADMSKFNFVRERVIDLVRVDGRDRETDSRVDPIAIGREKEREEIINMLMCSSSEENVSIISIVGIGGLGKTTLTQLVYCDKRVVEHFESMIWVCVSEDFERKSLVRRILQSITNKEVGDLGIDQLQRQLQENIDGKRYLLVLDDVWNEDYEKWLGVKKFLVGGAQGSKIMVTTRSKTVSSVMGVEDPYMLEGLTEEQSWNLFENIAFLGRKEVHLNIKAIGEQIVKRCKGVPLAIRSLGSVMKPKANESEWLVIRDSEVWSFCESENSIMPILKLSYDHLPIHLRQCFAFCSLFPKDHEFKKDLLVQLWMAQGYIQSSGGSQFLEETGDQYFEDLLSRSFFQDVERVGYYNEIDSCKMHDLIHDLALRVAGTHCRFITQNDAAVNISERLNHVSFENPSGDVLRQLLQARGLRTYFYVYRLSTSEEYIANMFLLSKFKRMRALDLRYCDFKELPKWVSKMQHLRYLDLSENEEIEVIPNSITKLVNLQTLNLRFCYNLKELPEGIGKLISLRHLVIDDCDEICHMPRGLEKLTSLRTLSKFIVGGDERRSIGIGALKDLNNLAGSLRIEKLEKVRDARLESKAANLMGKQYLKELILKWYKGIDFERVDFDGQTVPERIDAEILLEGLQPHRNLRGLRIEGYCGERLPSWMMGNMGISLPNIVEISLRCCPSIRQLPPTLYQLPCLKSLFLWDLPKVEYGCDGDGSSSSSSSPSFPSLTSLEIHNCPMLTSMPLAPLLETLNLRSVSEKLVCQQLSSSSLSKLISLTIDGYGGERFPSWMMGISLPNIVEISLRSCPNIRQLPPTLYQLPCLKSLELLNLSKVEYGGDGDGDESSSSSSSSSSPSLPCLTSLEILNCPMLTSMPLAPLLETLRLRSASEKLVCQQLSSSPLSSLSSLYIDGYSGERFPSLMMGNMGISLPNIVDISLSNCPNIKQLPPFCRLPCLKYLDLGDLPKVEYGGDCDGDGSSSSSSSPSFPSLTSLIITNCPMLTSMPLAPLLEKLELRSVSEKLVCQQLSSSPLSRLSYPTIEYIQDIEAPPLRNLTSLKKLSIWECTRLLCLAEIQHLTALEDLSIIDCEELDLSEDGMNWQALKSLRELLIIGVPKLVSLPEGLQHVTTLQSIQIFRCPGLVALPEWMSNLTSLKCLRIYNCPGLVALPEWMSNLTSLKVLSIHGCPLLSERCQEDTGEDWPNIAHIPTIYID